MKSEDLLQKIFQRGWTTEQLSVFLKKRGIIRNRKTISRATILRDINENKEIFPTEIISGYMVLSDNTVKEYIRFIIRTKKIEKQNGDAVNARKLVDDVDEIIEERWTKKKEEEILRGEIVNCFGPFDSSERRIINRRGLIKSIRRF